MKLIPRNPPGRTNRRARAFVDEIARLRQEGYGYVAIQEALADAGIAVSKSTVQREVARLSRSPPPPARRLPAAPAHAHPPPDSPDSWTPMPNPLTDPRRSGKDIAEAFMKSQITNPLFRSRS